MAVAIYGGSFNPPHLGHVNVADAVRANFDPWRFYIIPAGTPPHKEMASDSAASEHRMEMSRLAFGQGDGLVVSDMEIARGGKSFTSDTLRAFMEAFPGQELILVVGTDMFLSLDTWHEAEFILRTAHICVVRRDDEQEAIEAKAREYSRRFGTKTTLLGVKPLPASSTELRDALKQRKGRELLPEAVYAYIIAHRLYGAKPDFAWLREKAYAMLKPKRVPHVRGCEEEAIRLARRWGADEHLAAEAAILHDITKRLELKEQLILCDKYGIIPDTLEAKSEKLLHSKTGAALAREAFGVCDEVCEAIRWHTTGKADMSLLEKIIYLADYIEPTRDFEGVEKLRQLAYTDLDAALVLGFEMSLEDLNSYGVPPHRYTMEALEHYRRDGKI